MKKLTLVAICLLLAAGTGWAQLFDLCLEASPPWTICNGSLGSSFPCGTSPSCGTVYYGRSDGGGNQNEAGVYQCGVVVPVVYYIGCHHDMGLPTPNGAGASFSLRIAPAPVACNSLCGTGTELYNSDTHNCGGWTFSGLLTYLPSTVATYCVIAVSCGNDGWSCGGLTAIDDFEFYPTGPVRDWILY